MLQNTLSYVQAVWALADMRGRMGRPVGLAMTSDCSCSMDCCKLGEYLQGFLLQGEWLAAGSNCCTAGLGTVIPGQPGVH